MRGTNFLKKHRRAIHLVSLRLGKRAGVLFSLLLVKKPEKSDAIVLMQGDRFDRVKKTADLFKKGYTKRVFVTGNNDLAGRGKRNEENDVPIPALVQKLLQCGIPKNAIIIDETSLNTSAQATCAIRFAKKYTWQRLLVVTSPFHVLRAYLTFLRQAEVQKWRGEIIMQAADLSWNCIPSGRKRTAFAMLGIELEKIKKYRRDVASVRPVDRHIN